MSSSKSIHSAESFRNQLTKHADRDAVIKKKWVPLIVLRVIALQFKSENNYLQLLENRLLFPTVNTNNGIIACFCKHYPAHIPDARIDY